MTGIRQDDEPLAEALKRGLREAIAHARGAETGAIVHVVEPAAIDIKAIRKRRGLTQEKFSASYRIPLSALREWERGRRVPDPATRAYLLVIDREPKAVMRALAGPRS